MICVPRYKVCASVKYVNLMCISIQSFVQGIRISLPLPDLVPDSGAMKLPKNCFKKYFDYLVNREEN
jgi:hypothetical protein